MKRTLSLGGLGDGNFRSEVTWTGANGAVSTEVADVDGNMVLTIDRADGKVIETNATYDAFGNLLEERRNSGSRTSYAYDAKERTSEKKQYTSDGTLKYRTVYTYYGDDTLKEMYDYRISGSTETLYHYVYHTYDGLKRLKTTVEAAWKRKLKK